MLRFMFDEQRHDAKHARIQKEGGKGCPDPGLNNHKFIGFPSNIGPDPLKITKLPSQHSMCAIIGPARLQNAISMALRWQADNCPLLVFFWSLTPLKNNKNTQPYQSWTPPPSDKTFWIRAWQSSP